MKIRIYILLLLALLVSSCGASAPPPATITLEDVQSTSMAGAFTALAETHIALPTNTRVPPTEAPTQTLIPSSTPQASLTLVSAFTPTFTAAPTIVPTRTFQATATSQPTALKGDPCNKPLTSWQGPSTRLSIRYEYQPQSKKDKVVLSLWVVTDLKECGFLPSLSAGPVGQDSAIAYIDGEKDLE